MIIRLLLLALPVLAWLSGITATAAELTEFRGNAETPPLVLDDMHGRPHTLADYRGNVVLVNFWAGWCFPCVQEIPQMLRLAESLAEQPFIILAVNVGEEKRRLPGFVKSMDKFMVILMDTDSTAFKEWKGIGLPSTFVVDTTGQIRYEAYGAVNWDRADIVAGIKALIDEPTVKTAALQTSQQ
ncbi:MAG: TlpA disulfide reductase family protein [Gammaproteobacteria bacterium]|jgi:thiol-disulfide isomerase/thioredoxin